MKTTTRKRKNAAKETAAFSFTSGVARYARKDDYVAGNITFTMTGVEFDRGGGFQGEDRWKIPAIRDDSGASEIITLPTNEKRDAQLRDAAKHIAAHGPIPNVRLVKRGNAFYFRPAGSGGA